MHSQKKKKENPLGSALIKQVKTKMQKKLPKGDVISTIINENNNLPRIEESSLHDFIHLALLSNKNFEAIKVKGKLNSVTEIVENPIETFKQVITKFCEEFKGKKSGYLPLRIPRKPKYIPGMTKEQIIELESQQFLNWRKTIASIEENNINLSITPFEKNIKIWRHLWSTIERSHIILYIVDARNPMFFANQDLITYIKEVDTNKKGILLLNKSDFLSLDIRKMWSDFFDKSGLEYKFFSALMEQEKMEKNENYKNYENSESSENNENNEKKEEENFESLSKWDIFSRKQLIDYLKKERIILVKDVQKKLKVGMVGYPNVGKSSVINILCNSKKVAVAEQPGKTKHIQTIILDDEIELCDSPGIVFPSFSNNRAEMVCSGVISIDHLTEYLSPISLVCDRIRKEILEKVYGIILNQNYAPNELLGALSKSRGYVLACSLPDQAKAAKLILKDYFNGTLIYCHLPPWNIPEDSKIDQNRTELYNINIPEENSEISHSELENQEEDIKKKEQEIDRNILENNFCKEVDLKTLNKAQKRYIKHCLMKNQEPDINMLPFIGLKGSKLRTKILDG